MTTRINLLDLDMPCEHGYRSPHQLRIGEPGLCSGGKVRTFERVGDPNGSWRNVWLEIVDQEGKHNAN